MISKSQFKIDKNLTLKLPKCEHQTSESYTSIYDHFYVRNGSVMRKGPL